MQDVLYKVVVSGHWMGERHDATMQRLDPQDPRVTLLGDRGEGRYAINKDLWRMLHAAVITTLHIAAKQAREDEEQSDTAHHTARGNPSTATSD